MEINAVSSRGLGCTPICMQQDDACTEGAGWLSLPQILAVGLRLLKHVFERLGGAWQGQRRLGRPLQRTAARHASHSGPFTAGPTQQSSDVQDTVASKDAELCSLRRERTALLAAMRRQGLLEQAKRRPGTGETAKALGLSSSSPLPDGGPSAGVSAHNSRQDFEARSGARCSSGASPCSRRRLSVGAESLSWAGSAQGAAPVGCGVTAREGHPGLAEQEATCSPRHGANLLHDDQRAAVWNPETVCGHLQPEPDVPFPQLHAACAHSPEQGQSRPLFGLQMHDIEQNENLPWNANMSLPLSAAASIQDPQFRAKVTALQQLSEQLLSQTDTQL